jgi:hypothetical protein
MKFISGQPASLFFAWQIDVMLYNFQTKNINLSNVHLVMLHNDDIDPYYDKLIKKYPSANFYFYSDLRQIKKPITARAYAMVRHFDKHPELSEETVFYHDTDIVFLNELNFKKLEEECTVKTALLSETIYLKKYSTKNFFLLAADSIGIDPEIIDKNENNCGGAQHIIKGVDYNYWLDVFNRTEILENSLGGNTIAAKRVDMYALLWSLWMKGIETKLSKELDFCWPFTPISNKKAIYHDAASHNSPYLFNKQNFRNELPKNNLDVSRKHCSSLYYSILKEAMFKN